MMFSYSAKSFLQKRKASLRVEESSWSDPFTLDTIEDAGKVACKKNSNSSNKSERYEFVMTLKSFISFTLLKEIS